MPVPVRRVPFKGDSLSRYDEIIDVRAPREYLLDHLPDATNLPVLDDGEHSKVGTLYKQESPFEARKFGSECVARNIAFHLRHHFRTMSKSYHPLIYCWRGGQRSQALAHVLSETGWSVHVLEGGYKAFRLQVHRDLITLPTHKLRFRVLAGFTGSGKTLLLETLKEQGEQVLDLETLANHRGSLLGQIPGQAVMNQKRFESRIWGALQGFNPDKVVWVEGESCKIGKVFIPGSLFSCLKASLALEIKVPHAERVRYIVHCYPQWCHDKEQLMMLLNRFRQRYGNIELAKWQKWVNKGSWEQLVSRLLEVHYDPSYVCSRNRIYAGETACYPIEKINEVTLWQLARDLRRLWA